FDAIEIALHARSESNVEDVRKTLHHHALDLIAQLCGKESALLELSVSPVDERRDDRRVSRRTADAEPLELFHEARFGISGRRLGEMLRGRDLFHGHTLTNFDGRKGL